MSAVSNVAISVVSGSGVLVASSTVNLIKGKRSEKAKLKAASTGEFSGLEHDVTEIKGLLKDRQPDQFGQGGGAGLLTRVGNLETGQLATTAALTRLNETVASLDKFVRNGSGSGA